MVEQTGVAGSNLDPGECRHWVRRGKAITQSTGEQPKPQRKGSRWYPKRLDDLIVERWARACSRSHNDCSGCQYEGDCQDLVDRLIACMYVHSECMHLKPIEREKVKSR
ncbi:MAG: hypothetical protein A2Y72_00180 [Chloroflexi bacterium RBG_13_53_26]|nr:MAG: hypothetical protein A2Y72_00180 [Chloroflexi bacterium RBG_13_53_26]